MEKEEMNICKLQTNDEVSSTVEAEMAKLLQVFHRVQRISVVFAMELAPGECFVLQIIKRHRQEHPDEPGIYVSQIAGIWKKASSQVSRLLRGLEEKNLIGRSVDAKDRRNTYVFLTEHGTQVCDAMRERLDSYFHRVLEHMGKDNIDELVRLCNEMADVMEQELEEEKKKTQNR